MRIRTLSALIAVFAFIAIYWFFEIHGLMLLSFGVAFICVYEYSKLAFKTPQTPPTLKWSFQALCGLLVVASVFMDVPTAAIAQAAVYFLAIVLLTVSRKGDLQPAFHYQGAGLMGLLYVGVFPSLAIRLLRLEDGDIWFFGLLAIVFAGDTMAYITGRFLGRRKLLEAVSPKKTIEGSIGGLLGSALAGVVIAQYAPFELTSVLSTPAMVAVAIVSGAFAQIGDLVESMLKRVAEVKDSGHIMPGHGGMLDRLDGVLFAAPVYFSLVHLLLHFSES
ncbi:MAG TPA: phosphatidate cytidylyltransferase [Pseudobdellovibrionaceae bacterium]|nr:phosphatidate cytidylyltransferase [Pseudobdellovibrionaceae bacterium]